MGQVTLIAMSVLVQFSAFINENPVVMELLLIYSALVQIASVLAM
jgi:hypothetical protein